VDGPSPLIEWRLLEDFSEGNVLGGVEEPWPVFTLEEDLLEGSTAL